jgi:hypothetical protein
MGKYSFILILFLCGKIMAQLIPAEFSLEKNKLNKSAEDRAPIGNGVEYIEFMGEDIWIATSSGLSKSTDGGDNWTNYEFGEEGISALGINNDTVWIATWHPLEVDNDIVPVGSGIHFSPDKGDTWISIEQPVDQSDDSSIVYGVNTLRALPLPVPEGNFTRDIGFLKNEIWIASFYGGLRKSSDNGETWEKVVVPPDYLDSIHPDSTYDFTLSPSSGGLGFENNLNHRFFSIRAVNDSTIYIGTADGINRSSDGGKSWRKFNHQNQTNSMSGNFILDINYDRSRDIVWAATWKAEGQTEFYGLSSTDDGGENWKTFLQGENIHDIAFTYNFSGTEKDIFVATDNGVFRSRDIGESWILAPDMRDDNTGISITTNNFRAVNAILDFSGNNDMWFGSEAGSAKLKETGSIWQGEWLSLIHI